MLAGPDPLVVLHMPGERARDESLHNLPGHCGHADRPVVPRILLLALLVQVGKEPLDIQSYFNIFSTGRTR